MLRTNSSILFTVFIITEKNCTWWKKERDCHLSLNKSQQKFFFFYSATKLNQFNRQYRFMASLSGQVHALHALKMLFAIIIIEVGYKEYHKKGQNWLHSPPGNPKSNKLRSTILPSIWQFLKFKSCSVYKGLPFNALINALLFLPHWIHQGLHRSPPLQKILYSSTAENIARN